MDRGRACHHGRESSRYYSPAVPGSSRRKDVINQCACYISIRYCLVVLNVVFKMHHCGCRFATTITYNSSNVDQEVQLSHLAPDPILNFNLNSPSGSGDESLFRSSSGLAFLPGSDRSLQFCVRATKRQGVVNRRRRVSDSNSIARNGPARKFLARRLMPLSLTKRRPPSHSDHGNRRPTDHNKCVQGGSFFLG